MKQYQCYKEDECGCRIFDIQSESGAVLPACVLCPTCREALALGWAVLVMEPGTALRLDQGQPHEWTVWAAKQTYWGATEWTGAGHGTTALEALWAAKGEKR